MVVSGSTCGRLGQSQGLQGLRCQAPIDVQLLGYLVFRNRVAGRRSVNAIDWTVVVSELRELFLNSANRRILHRRVAVNALIIIVRFYVSVVARVIVVRI